MDWKYILYLFVSCRHLGFQVHGAKTSITVNRSVALCIKCYVSLSSNSFPKLVISISFVSLLATTNASKGLCTSQPLGA
jgi:hypothetical protein